MPDLDERLRGLDDVVAPDLWADIGHRRGRPPRTSTPRRRTLATVMAVAVAALGLAVGLRAFLTEDSRPVVEPVPTGPPGNGEIWFRKGGGDGPSYVHVINPDGTGERELFGDGGDPQDQHVNPEAVGEGYDWSPDGARVAFADYSTFNKEHNGSEWEIFVMSPEGSGRTQVTADHGLASDPSWSPDGSMMAYAGSRSGEFIPGCWGLGDLCPSDIYVINADGTNKRQLTDDPADDSQPDWSPDGSSLVFRSTRDDPAGDIYVMNADGPGLSRLTNDPGFQSRPVWSPDGSRIAFVGWSTGEAVDVFVMTSDGTGITNLTDNTGNSFVQSLTWSPDGTRLAFSSDLEGAEVGLYVMNAVGSGLTKLAAHAGDIAWRPIPTAG